MKNLSFFLLFVFGEIGPEKDFVGVVNRKLACQHYKNIGLRKSQNLHFSKGKFFFIFSSFRFWRNRARKGAKDYKNIGLRKSQNLHSSKGARPWFWSKIRNFFFFSFLAKYAEKRCLVTF